MRQPAVQLKNDQPNAYRVVGDLHDSDQIMNNTLFGYILAYYRYDSS